MTGHRLILLLVLFLAACDKPPRLPYVPPELHHWPNPYKGVAGLRLHVFTTGTLTVPSKVVYQGGSLFETSPLDVLVFVIEHPRHGLILVGTGLNRHIADRAESYLGSLRASLGHPAMSKGQDILSQLQRAKLPAEKVRQVILPDLRFDHTGEVASFSSAQMVVASAEFNAAADQEDSTLSVPEEYDTVRQWQFIDFAGAKPLGTFRAHRDLFGDGSVLLIDVTGVTSGGLAVLVRLPTTPVLLCGNLAWTKAQYYYTRFPGLLFDRNAWWDNIWRLKKFTDLAPELVVLPDHDWSAVATGKTKDIVLHPFSATAVAEEDTRKNRPESSAKKETTSRPKHTATKKKKMER